MRFARLCAAVLAAAACGRHEGGAASTGSGALRISPSATQVSPGGTQVFVASGGGPVAWSVVEGPAAGTIDANGKYTAPAAGGSYHVVAASRADARISATALVNVAPIQLALTPADARLESGQSLQFTASVNGPDPRVTWSVLEGGAGGIVDATGLYVAPQATGTFHLVAASVADPSRRASAEIAVSPSAVRVRISPLAVTLSPGASLQFSATVAGGQDPGVDWSSDCCTLRSDGTFTAGDEGSFTVTARSRADSAQTAVARVTVQKGADIDPAAVTLEAGGRVSFHAHPEDAWSVLEAEGGSITTAGAYQAPIDRGGTFHVVAASGGRTSTAVVTVVPRDLIDHGGPVVPSTRTFALFWGDLAGFPADLRPLQEALLGNLGGSGYLALADQYLRGATASTRFGGTLSDPSAPPDSPDKAGAQAIGAEGCRALQAAGIAPEAGDLVFVYSSAALSPLPGWCAWHSTYDCGGTTLLVSFVPAASGSSACLRLGADIGCNGASAEANATASLTAHELLEAITDPLVTAWTDAAGQELADKCESEPRCIQLSGGAFQLQAEYSNAAHACAP